jgi:hypothetical protein
MCVADVNEVTVYSEVRKKHTKKRKRPSTSDGSEQNKPRKKQPKAEVLSPSSEPMVVYPETQMSSIPGCSIDNNPVVKKVSIKRVKKMKIQNQEDRLQTDMMLPGDEKLFDEAGKCTGNYYTTFNECLVFVLSVHLIYMREIIRDL